MRIRNGVADGHRTGQFDLEHAARMGTGKSQILAVHRATPPYRPRHRRYLDLIAIVANAHFRLLAPVDALDPLQETMDEMDARLLAVGDDVDSGVFLLFEPDQSGVALPGHEGFAFKTPTRPQFFHLREPQSLLQTARDHSLQPGPIA